MYARIVVCVNKMDTDAVQFSEERFLAACQVVAWTEGRTELIHATSCEF